MDLLKKKCFQVWKRLVYLSFEYEGSNNGARIRLEFPSLAFKLKRMAGVDCSSVGYTIEGVGLVCSWWTP